MSSFAMNTWIHKYASHQLVTITVSLTKLCAKSVTCACRRVHVGRTRDTVRSFHQTCDPALHIWTCLCWANTRYCAFISRDLRPSSPHLNVSMLGEHEILCVHFTRPVTQHSTSERVYVGRTRDTCVHFIRPVTQQSTSERVHVGWTRDTCVHFTRPVTQQSTSEPGWL